MVVGTLSDRGGRSHLVWEKRLSRWHGGTNYRLCISNIGHPAVVLRDSSCYRRGCLAGVEEAELGVVDRIYITHPC